MSTIRETVTVEGDELTLSLIVWRRFKKPMPGLLEQILDANPGLADLGSFLPLGTIFEMPVPVLQENPVLDPIRLW